MLRAGHYGAALLAYAPVAFLVAAAGAPDLGLGGGVATAALAKLPDWDRWLPNVEHRGVTHTVWFALAVAIAGAIVGGGLAADSHPTAMLGLAALGGTIGGLAVGSHIAVDALTPMGVRPFAPVDDRHVSYGLAESGDRVANLLLLLVGGALTVSGWTWGVSLGG